MTTPKWKHRPCPCGCGEMADECMRPSSPFNAFQIRERADYPTPYTPRHAGGVERTVQRYRDAYTPRHGTTTGGASCSQCRKAVGTNPGWLNADQYDAIACRCVLTAGHDGPHRCVDHDGATPFVAAPKDGAS